MTQTRLLLAVVFVAAAASSGCSAWKKVAFWEKSEKGQPLAKAVEPGESPEEIAPPKPARAAESVEPKRAAEKEAKKNGTRELRPEDFVGTPRQRPIARREPGVQAAPVSFREMPQGSGDDADLDGNSDAAPMTASTNGKTDRALNEALEKLPKPHVTAAIAPATQPAGASGGYVMDAMVGQVNGQPIYANVVFEPMREELARLGQQMPRPMFRDRAQDLIAKRLNEIVFDALIVGEAERDLSSQEQMGLQNRLKEIREEILRVEGQSSEAVANKTLLEREGITVDQKMHETRQKLLVRRYMGLKLMPKVHVTRKDVERYYQDHYTEYNPPAGRTLRVIRAASNADAARIEKLLAEGKPFAEVAGMSVNAYQRDTAGLMIDAGAGEKVFGLDELNEALAELEPGRHSERIKIGDSSWWVFLESVNQGKARPLREVQLEIEKTLREQRYRAATKGYQDRLFAEGSYNPIDKMTDALVEVAVSRYALPE